MSVRERSNSADLSDNELSVLARAASLSAFLLVMGFEGQWNENVR
uniref:Uncharacterized protein n=1 Tax=Citrobacter freundii TaxID=546 RepID=A0A0K2S3Q6_CITFR|nr:hypothetical protein [Citrobacter freundii]